MQEFIEMRKIPRGSREVLVTEKLDGTSALVYISPEGEFLCGSRTRWITPENDNYGFAKWATAHMDELMMLGPGHHFGEWWGSGIQRGYGLPSGEKHWSLFNVQRWCLKGQTPKELVSAALNKGVPRFQEVLPGCVELVPLLWRGNMDDFDADAILKQLRAHGSFAAPFLNPEGVVVLHIAGNVLFKKTLEHDSKPKSSKEIA